jgi:hypothetical protein
MAAIMASATPGCLCTPPQHFSMRGKKPVRILT